MHKYSFLNDLLVIYFTCCCILPVIVPIHGNVLANQSTNPLPVGNSGEFKLTKLLNIELGGEPGKLMNSDFRNTILSEVQRGIANGYQSSTELQEPIHRRPENYNQEQFITVLKELKQLQFEVSELQRNISYGAYYPLSECLIQSDISEGTNYPVGTSFHQLCSSKALNKGITQTKNYLPRSCKEIQEQGKNVSGVYEIKPKRSEKPFTVLCDMETNGGGWTHIQKRYDGSVDFLLGWREYKFGFGDLGSEFWIGLENIYKMTGFEVSELLVEVVDTENHKEYAHYKAFGIGSESDGYPLNTLRGFSGDAGDALTYHLGCKFTTKDFDQDSDSGNCAEKASGAWWYKTCFASNLNGKYRNTILPDIYEYRGIHWQGHRGIKYCFSKSRMLVRSVEG